MEINLFDLTSSASDVEDVFGEEVKINFDGQPINLKIVRNITDKKENGEIDGMYSTFCPTSENGKRRGTLAVEVENKKGVFTALSMPMDHPSDFESMNLPMVKLFVPNMVQILANKLGSPITLTVNLRGVEKMQTIMCQCSKNRDIQKNRNEKMHRGENGKKYALHN